MHWTYQLKTPFESNQFIRLTGLLHVQPKWLKCTEKAEDPFSSIGILFSTDDDVLTSSHSDPMELNFAKESLKESQVDVAHVSLRFLYSFPESQTPSLCIPIDNEKLHKIEINSLIPIQDVEVTYQYLHAEFMNYVTNYRKAFIQSAKESNRFLSHFFIANASLLVCILYGTRSDVAEDDALSTSAATELNLPDSSVLRRSNSISMPDYFTRYLGPNEENLVCPHLLIKDKRADEGNTQIVQGKYTYKHYLQDQMDDKNWGCAYRSLQTMASWLMWQNAIPVRRLPTHRTIQKLLVKIGDKDKTFIGSKQWIGSLEISYFIDKVYAIQCVTLPLASGSAMPKEAAPQLAEHFECGGGPVMIGGGQLAHTIIGVQILSPSSARYLVLDPHYVGRPGDAAQILKKGWCGWKEDSFWKSNVFYNLCFLPPCA